MAGGVGRGQPHLKTLLSERVHEPLIAQQDRVAILLRHGHPRPDEEGAVGGIGCRPAINPRIVHARWTTGPVGLTADARPEARDAVAIARAPTTGARPKGGGRPDRK